MGDLEIRLRVRADAEERDADLPAVDVELAAGIALIVSSRFESIEQLAEERSAGS